MLFFAGVSYKVLLISISLSLMNYGLSISSPVSIVTRSFSSSELLRGLGSINELRGSIQIELTEPFLIYLFYFLFKNIGKVAL
jgi:hypothetical protein